MPDQPIIKVFLNYYSIINEWHRKSFNNAGVPFDERHTVQNIYKNIKMLFIMGYNNINYAFATMLEM